MPIPAQLEEKSSFYPATNLPEKVVPFLQEDTPVIIYNSYNLDPTWHTGEQANRILLLEPNHFKKYPISEKVIQFVIDLSKNIEGIQIFTGNFDELKTLAGNRSIIYKSHPTAMHYKGLAEQTDDLFPQVTGYFPSFFSYWKKCVKYLG